MNKIVLIFFIVSGILFFDSSVSAQNKIDSAKIKAEFVKKLKVNTVSPRKAAIRSAILPGLGQIYNKKYWKLPLVYGAIGVTTGIFIYNVNNYKRLRDAYRYKTDTFPQNDILVYYKFRNLSSVSIKSYRNSFRQNVDYSVLFFLLFS